MLDEAVNEIDLVVRARRQAPLVDDLGRRYADRALAPVQEVAAAKVAGQFGGVERVRPALYSTTAAASGESGAVRIGRR